jgi:hypothetical protein
MTNCRFETLAKVGAPMEIITPRRGLPSHFGWLGQISWGHGIIGKATVAIVALFVMLGVLGLRAPPDAILILACFGLGVIVLYMIFLAAVAHFYPALAATEGPTYVESQRLLAAKNLPAPPVAEIVADPQNPTLLDAPPKNQPEA